MAAHTIITFVIRLLVWRSLVWSPEHVYAKHAHNCQNNRGAKLAWAESGAEAMVSKRPSVCHSGKFVLFIKYLKKINNKKIHVDTKVKTFRRLTWIPKKPDKKKRKTKQKIEGWETEQGHFFSIQFKYLSEKLPLSQNYVIFRGSRFSQCFQQLSIQFVPKFNMLTVIFLVITNPN